MKKIKQEDLPQDWNALALRNALKDTKELHAVVTKDGFKIFGKIDCQEEKFDLVEDICDYTGWKNRNGYIGSKDFDPKFAEEVIADFGKNVWGDPKRFKLNKVIDISHLTTDRVFAKMVA